MRIILHIGQSKTGTSAIQGYLTLNRLQLRRKGILYPNVTISNMPVDIGNHNSLADALAGLSRFPHLTVDQYFDQYFTEAKESGAKCMILSAEHFFGGEPRIWDVSDEKKYFDIYSRKIKAVARFLDGHKVWLLVYLRPQVDWLASAISQTVRIEQLISPGKSIYQNDRQFFEMTKPLLRYCRLIDIWDSCLCPQKVTVIPYERECLHKKSAVADFLYQTGLDNLYLPYGSENLQVNSSLSREYTEVKKILNRTFRSKNEERVIITCLARLSSSNSQFIPYQLSDELLCEVMEFVKPDNERLNRVYVQHGNQLKAQSTASLDRDNNCPSQEDIAAALSKFKKEFSSPRIRLLAIDYAIRTLLREHVKPMHSALHQLKRMYRLQVYRK